MESFKQEFKQKLLYLREEEFKEMALSLFQFQFEYNFTYQAYVKARGINPDKVTELTQIPFLPISFFKDRLLRSGSFVPEIIFTSSGTTGPNSSEHAVSRKDFYVKHARNIFRQFYGELNQYVIFALLPSYLEREGSSLILMAEDFIKQSGSDLSGFYLYDNENLFESLQEAKALGKKVILLGVTFALLDFAELYQIDFPELIVMETGGMKGRRKELVRQEVHEILKAAFGVYAIHSEYGMTELISQAYSHGEGIYTLPNFMKVLIRDPNDPYDIGYVDKRGGINLIDLGNIDSCAFIESMDMGILHQKGTFEIIGRFDNSDLRGCNLMVL